MSQERQSFAFPLLNGYMRATILSDRHTKGKEGVAFMKATYQVKLSNQNRVNASNQAR
jgi:hypothetical protein